MMVSYRDAVNVLGADVVHGLTVAAEISATEPTRVVATALTKLDDATRGKVLAALLTTLDTHTDYTAM